jgi:uncharacterized protein YodC (DUF2158 family)
VNSDTPKSIRARGGLKTGDLVVLKSGGPVMTVDAVNTDIYEPAKVTGVSCVWFVGEKLERVRFDPHSIRKAPRAKKSPPEQ